MNETDTLIESSDTAAAEGSPEKKGEQKSYSHAELVGELLENRPHGTQVKLLAQNVFGPALGTGKAKSVLSAAVCDILGTEIAEYFPKQVWADIARTGEKGEVANRMRNAVGSLHRNRDALKAIVCSRIDEITDTMFLVADGRQNMSGGQSGAEWLTNAFNVKPDRSTEKKIVLHQLFGKAPESKSK